MVEGKRCISLTAFWEAWCYVVAAGETLVMLDLYDSLLLSPLAMEI